MTLTSAVSLLSLKDGPWYWLSRVPAMESAASLSCSPEWRFRRNRPTSEVAAGPKGPEGR